MPVEPADRGAPIVTGGPMQRAVALMTVSSALVPIVGVLSAPLLAQGLGVDGRGQLSVATAPGVLLAGVVTFGLPEALTYFTARSPRLVTRYLTLACSVTVATAILGIGLMAALAPLIAGGDPDLALLIVLGSTLALPLLLLGLLRSAAAGLQLWGTIAIERAATSLFRLGLVAGLLVTGHLTVLTALLATTAGPLIGVLAFAPVLMRARRSQGTPAAEPAEFFDEAEDRRGWRRPLVGYALSTWFGAVAGIFLSRINQVLFAPLSTVEQLGLYVVAVTIADVPLIVAIAIRDAVFGVGAQQQDAGQIAAVNRVTLFLGLLASAAIGVSTPFWIGPVFGDAFVGAVPAVLLLLVSSVVNVPVFILSAGVAALGDPRARSIGLSVALAVNIVLFLVLVPMAGAVGAALAALGAAVAAAVFICWRAHRNTGIGLAELLLVRRSDLHTVSAGLGRMGPLSRLRRGRRGPGERPE